MKYLLEGFIIIFILALLCRIVYELNPNNPISTWTTVIMTLFVILYEFIKWINE